MRHTRLWPLTAALTSIGIALMTSTAAQAQQVVYDPWSMTQLIQQYQQGAEQLLQLQQQLSQAQQLYGSLNKLTSMGDIASVLNNPAVRQALPSDYATIAGLLQGNGTGAAGASAQLFQGQNNVYTAPGNDFYAQTLRAGASRNAGNQSLAQQMYDAASLRIGGIEQLRQQIGQSPDPKTTLDLQARLQVEMSAMQADLLRMNALRMLQQAQLDVARQQDSEQWRLRLDGLTGSATTTQ